MLEPWFSRSVLRLHDNGKESLKTFWLAGLVALLLLGCSEAPKEATHTHTEAKEPPKAAPVASIANGQRGQGQPYEVIGSEVWDVPDPVSGRDYQVFVALPKSYAEDAGRRYPVLYVTDADYAFPLARQIGRRLNVEEPTVEDFILVGLSYAVGEEGMPSRRRDYTPSPKGPSDAPAGAVHGGGEAYLAYLREQVLPFVAQRYRTDESRRLFLGHSYGSLLGTQALLTHPGMFSGYILGSPSYWYDGRYMERLEAASAKRHEDLAARVYLYVGEYENPRHGKRYDMVEDARRMARALQSRRYPSLRIALDVLNDEDHMSVAPRGFTHGLKYLLGVGAAGSGRQVATGGR
ncbi:alpha/beta hydrolase [[Pseudomonas] boreopolis]|uniref:alpha/beta hydrolase n=1 Tax=Xanthomonas boreopolis TaxID=86183 RepID=UPI003D52CBB9